MSDLLAAVVSEFRQGYPDVPAAEGVDVEGIKADDANAMFVTLPIVRVGAQSRNGFAWKPKDVQRIVQQINTKKVEGFAGHITEEERTSKFEFPHLRWIGAKLEADGTAWGKAYVVSEQARKYFQMAKRANARVGTSVYGTQGARGLEDMTLESIDLGHPDRLGLPDAAAIPKITSEMAQGKEGKTMDGNETQGRLVSELTTQRDSANLRVAELQGKLVTAEGLVAELQKKLAPLDTVGALVSEFAGATVADKVGTLISELSAFKAAVKRNQISAVVAELVKLEALRPIIINEMGDKATDEASARVLVAELLTKPHIKTVAAALTQATLGPNAFLGAGADGNDWNKRVEDPAFGAAARNMFGI